MTQIVPGSYEHSFAPRDHAPAYPSLWKGCIGAWCPSLGPTGATLYDWSRTRRHGLLTDMELSSDWVVSEGRHALKFETNDWVDLGSGDICQSRKQLTICAWMKRRLTTSIVTFGIRHLSSPDYAMIECWNDGNVYYSLATTTASYGSFSNSSVGWQHLGMVFDGNASGNSGRLKGFLNGRQVSLSYFATIPSSTTSVSTVLRIGRNTVSPFFSDGMVDDLRIYDRALLDQEMRLLGSRRGIAYDWKRRVYSAGSAPAGNRRRRVLIGS